MKFIIILLLASIFTFLPGIVLPAIAADTFGVWMVTISVNKVAEVKRNISDTAVAPTPTGAEFPLRILLHDDGVGNVRLLKEAIAMKDPATGKVVALADSGLASIYTGVVLRGGTLVGLRSSAIGYDFKGSTKDCTGALANSDNLECSFAQLSDDANNPFLHRFHPDHDNLDESFTGSGDPEAFAITRSFTLTFSPRYPANPDEPERSVASKPLGWGVTYLGGTYSESITGLHKDPLSVSGWFTMKRIAAIADLRR